MQKQTFSKFIRPEVATPGPITDRDLDLLDAILTLPVLPASQLVGCGGNEDVTTATARLWKKGIVNRWAFPASAPTANFIHLEQPGPQICGRSPRP